MKVAHWLAILAAAALTGCGEKAPTPPQPPKPKVQLGVAPAETVLLVRHPDPGFLAAQRLR
jgi:hypothetical protein